MFYSNHAKWIVSTVYFFSNFCLLGVEFCDGHWQSDFCLLFKLILIFSDQLTSTEDALWLNRFPLNNINACWFLLQILALDNMIKLTLITIAHSFHHTTLPKNFDNLLKYLKTSHSYNTRIRSDQNFFKPSVNTNIGKKSIQYRGVEAWKSLKWDIKLLGSTTFRTQVKNYVLDID